MQHMENNNINTLLQIRETSQAINCLYEDQMEKKAKFIKQNYYENIPKANNFLAWRIRNQQADRFIQKIKTPTDKKTNQYLKRQKTLLEIITLNYIPSLMQQSPR